MLDEEDEQVICRNQRKRDIKAEGKEIVKGEAINI